MPNLNPAHTFCCLQFMQKFSPLLGTVAVTGQEPHNLACYDARLHGIGCILNATQMAAGVPQWLTAPQSSYRALM